MNYYALKAQPMDKDIKSALIRVKSIVNNPDSRAARRFVKWDGKHFVGLYNYPSGKWGVSIVVLKTGEVKMSATINANQVVGWVYSAINRIQYLKYNKHSKLARCY